MSRNAEFPPVQFPSVQELIPHSGDVLLIDRILDHDGESTLTLVDIGRQRWLKREDGSVASWLAMEYMAQSIAVHEGLLARAENRELPRGFLLSALGLRLYASGFAALQRLFAAGLVVRVTGDTLILAPALVAEHEHVDRICEIVRGVLGSL